MKGELCILTLFLIRKISIVVSDILVQKVGNMDNLF